MVTRLLKRYSDRFLSRWIVFIYDVVAVYGTYIVANLIRHNFEFLTINPYVLESQSVAVMLIYMLSFLALQSFSGIIRHTSISDAVRIFKATGLAFVVLMAIRLSFSDNELTRTFVPALSVIVIHFLLSLFFLVGSRFIIKSIYNDIVRKERKKQVRVLIYGAGAAGMLTRSALLQDVFYNFQVVAFADDNHSKVNKMLDGIPVISPDKALSQAYIERHDISQMIISIQKLDLNHKKQIIEKGLELKLQVKVVPAIDNWINGQLSSSQLRKVNIEELLERDPISLNNENVSHYLHNKIIMVTGAAGSIGSEIVRQVLQYKPARVVLVDQAESPLYELQYEINNVNPYKQFASRAVYVIANVKDRFRMEGVFKMYQPQIIFHAAAYKHVPLMEDNPYEALLVNVFGTKVIADLSVKYGVQKFVMVSTDKAVNPTNVMGASKRIAEIYTQSIMGKNTQFITTRFGNVLGSNGSVIPLFKKQIEKGGPVTLTHKDITRYFMTIPEACNLVLEAGAMGNGGEIFVFDMGKPVKIYDLARKMIQLSGLIPEKDIKIIETGLRPGEKLYEELLAGQENTIHTHHPKIMRARVRENNSHDAELYLRELSELIVEGDEFALVKKMKQIVPEFISNNSVFSRLDKQGEA
ncbi:MAG: polysaccharide biosynthesis protein [Bacteroidales bacterium]|nr:polysaccharide biosynthesis protein [Bacteroidales bacterium]